MEDLKVVYVNIANKESLIFWKFEKRYLISVVFTLDDFDVSVSHVIHIKANDLTILQTNIARLIIRNDGENLSLKLKDFLFYRKGTDISAFNKAIFVTNKVLFV